MQTATTTPLRAAREARGLSQRALAKGAGLSRVALIHLEAGDAQPKLSTARKLARALNSTVDELFPEHDPDAIEQPRKPHSLRHRTDSSEVDIVLHLDHFELEYREAKTGRLQAVETAGKLILHAPGGAAIQLNGGADPRPRERRDSRTKRSTRKCTRGSPDGEPERTGPGEGLSTQRRGRR